MVVLLIMLMLNLLVLDAEDTLAALVLVALVVLVLGAPATLSCFLVVRSCRARPCWPSGCQSVVPNPLTAAACADQFITDDRLHT